MQTHIIYKTKLAKRPLTRHPILRQHVLHDAELRLHRGSKLAMRLIITKKGKDNFLKVARALGGTVDRNTLACVRNFSQYWTEHNKKTHRLVRDWYEVDRRYWCAMILQENKCRVETMAHECAHAGILYALRNPRYDWEGNARGQLIDLGKPLGFNPPHDIYDEGCEKLAYPIGLISRHVTIKLHDWKIW